MFNSRKYSSIVGLSDTVRIPRLGRIRLGHLNHNTLTQKTYPQEDAYFHVPPEVAEVYGHAPTELDIMFPVNDRAVIFPQALEYYGGSKRLLCTGNGKEARRWNQEKLDYLPCACPCPFYENGCSERGHLMVILPKVKNQGGVYQIDTGSIQSITAVNSTLNILAPEKEPDNGLLGYFAMTPMKLRRVTRDIYPDGKHKISYPLQISLTADDADIERLRARKDDVLAKTRCWIVEEPEQLNPATDTGAPVTIDDQPIGSDAGPPQHQQEGTADQAPPPSAQVLTDPDQPATPPPASSSTISQSPPVPVTPSPAAPAEPPTGNGKPLNMMITRPQIDRILSHTQTVNLPDEVVRERIKDLSKRDASDLITKLARQDFQFFERSERTSTRVPLSA